MDISKKKRYIGLSLSVIILLPFVFALNGSLNVFNISTDKVEYSLGEDVIFTLTPDTPNFSISIIHPNYSTMIYQYTYVPPFIGNYLASALFFLDNDSGSADAEFSVYDNYTTNTTPTVEENVSNETASVVLFDSLIEEAKLEKKFKKLIFRNLKKIGNKTELFIERQNSKTQVFISGDYNISDIKDVFSGRLNRSFYKGADEYSFSTEVFAINDLAIDNATIELEAFSDVDEIMYCKNFNFAINKCPSNSWVSSGEGFVLSNGKIVFDVNHFSAWVGVSVFHNASDFNGTFNQTQLNGTSITLLNNSNTTYYLTGNYTSPVYDAGKVVTWKNISWEETISIGFQDSFDGTTLNTI
ncbi:hypothetical protein GOV08_00865, partial [Candidatus Woesearchaeota archaeon]|nr:hypothetical protein [Candidatus Woesearchaeota archaeon]